ncbi:efflux RND transporter periplasmic adaptor subunit [Flagellimonas pacifica]|uniref:Membrane fusion protein, cobalt-zinc-cadmium efflux system n=1 Tax=Flagellimonas pacifica TaxID=1247520 RepID=A0A285MCP5_9FLAO|nr:efflux RND transporter periplasmic adaptor subunit [Allomuricauda parva]SNY94945.1 membrane fusion protein, cobalt-zinc-cadmium efflux system [Allomuricauda parva]
MIQSLYKITTLSLLFALLSCGGKTKSSEVDLESKEQMDDRIQVTQAQFEQNKMTLGSLEEMPFPTSINVNGMIDVPPGNRVVVNASMGGYIKTTPLLIGDKVHKGQVLVTIENPEFIALQQEYMEVSGQLTYLKAEYERQKTMTEENITSQKSYLKAESNYKTAVAKHTGLGKQLQMLNISPLRVSQGNFSSVATIYAPISGSVTKMNVTKGTYVSPSTSILEIIDNEHIHLELSVFEKDIMKVKKGQDIDFKIPEVSTETFKAKVHLVGTAIEETRTIKVHGHLENESENNFLTGMFVEASIYTDFETAKTLPNEALVVADEIPYVLVLEKKEGNIYYFKQEEVTVKATSKGYTIIEIKNTFTPNTQFLTKGAFNLLGD